MSKGRKRNTLSVRSQLTCVFLVSVLLSFLVNLYIFSGINYMMEQVDNSYYSNAQLIELESAMNDVHTNLKEYLVTQTYDSMVNYYSSRQDFTALVEKLSSSNYGNRSAAMEKSIKNMSQCYLDEVAEAVEAKRGRDTAGYTESYERSEVLYQYIHTYIYSLNNAQFESNTAEYERLFKSQLYAERISVAIMVLVGVLTLMLVLVLTSNIIDPIETHLLDARLKYLQAQVNPHFLFNTLNAGAQLAMMEGAEHTYEYIQNVADFYRYNINRDMDETTLENELKTVDNYIYIINVRFSNEICYRKELDESLLSIRMPSMILQPIIENCINHGLQNIEREKCITLRVWREEKAKRACVSVCDNGIGISPEKILEIENDTVKPDENNKNSNGIGITNVINRLRIFYNRDDVVEISSAGENLGTEVALFLPLADE